MVKASKAKIPKKIVPLLSSLKALVEQSETDSSLIRGEQDTTDLWHRQALDVCHKLGDYYYKQISDISFSPMVFASSTDFVKARIRGVNQTKIALIAIIKSIETLGYETSTKRGKRPQHTGRLRWAIDKVLAFLGIG